MVVLTGRIVRHSYYAPSLNVWGRGVHNTGIPMNPMSPIGFMGMGFTKLVSWEWEW